MKLQHFLFFGAWLPLYSHGAEVSESSVSIPFPTVFTKTETPVTVELVWEDPTAFDPSDVLNYTISGDGEEMTTSMGLDTATELPSTLDAIFVTTKGGTVDIVVTVELNGEVVTTASTTSIAYGEGASLVPLIIILILGFTTQLVELSLGFGIFVGACMVSGGVSGGFTTTLEKYILEAVGDIGHAYVYMFTAFLGGFVGLLQKSGGFQGFAEMVVRFARNSQIGQLVAYLAGWVIFFDDYANCLVVGGSLRSSLYELGVSREKLAFIVDATAAPLASLVPISSWIGFEVGLIQDELDKISEKLDGAELYTASTGMSVFLESTKYRYYSIFMLLFIPITILLKRDFGPMLVAERKTIVYDRKDGGDSKGNQMDESYEKLLEPAEDTPTRVWNFFVPVFFLIFFIFYILVDFGDDGSGTQSIRDKIESSDSYVALLWGTMAAALVAMLFYMIQFKKGGEMASPTAFFSDEKPAPLLSVKEGVDAFLAGQMRIVPALVVLTLAWAAGSVMSDVGADRLFERWILDSGLNPAALPTLSFLIAMLIALSTGTSWGTMGILFPLLIGPTYTAADGDVRIFYATVSSVLAGAIMGDHVSPISDTTILACLACDCGLMQHVKTQIPYAGVVALWSVLAGTVPIGYNESYKNAGGIILGLVLIIITVFGLGAPVVSESGRFDIGTELYMKIYPNKELQKLKEDTIAYYKKGTEVKSVDDKETLDDVKTGVEETA